MKICLVRHGETDYNAEKRLQGQVEIPMNANGRAQAAETARALALLHWDRIFTSPLGRAKETAQMIADACGLSAPEVLPDLIERCLGIAEGWISPEISEENRALMREEKLEGIEPKAAVRDRMVKTVTETMARYPGENLIFVSHGGAIRAFLSSLSDKQRKVSQNCSINLLEADENGMKILLEDVNAEQLRKEKCI